MHAVVRGIETCFQQVSQLLAVPKVLKTLFQDTCWTVVLQLYLLELCFTMVAWLGHVLWHKQETWELLFLFSLPPRNGKWTSHPGSSYQRFFGSKAENGICHHQKHVRFFWDHIPIFFHPRSPVPSSLLHECGKPNDIINLQTGIFEFQPSSGKSLGISWLFNLIYDIAGLFPLAIQHAIALSCHFHGWMQSPDHPWPSLSNLITTYYQSHHQSILKSWFKTSNRPITRGKPREFGTTHLHSQPTSPWYPKKYPHDDWNTE